MNALNVLFIRKPIPLLVPFRKVLTVMAEKYLSEKSVFPLNSIFVRKCNNYQLKAKKFRCNDF